MIRRLTRWALLLVSLFVALTLAAAAFTAIKNRGWLTPLGVHSETSDSQVIQAIERTQEVSLLSLGIQGITQEERSAEIFGHTVPGSSEKVFLLYDFKAKLGINGANVRVARSGPSAYRISVPGFSFIGYDKPTFKVGAEDGGILSWATADIDKVEMINRVLSDVAQQKYIASNEEVLKDQTKIFYDTLITSIDPAATTTYEFRS